MDFWQIGNIRQYAKSIGSRTVWNLKKQSGDLTGHGKTLHTYVSRPKAASPLPQEDRDDRLTGIINKAQAGKKLSQDDWEYLRTKNPQLYQKLRQVEQEAESYEKALRRCKTRDEVQRLHTSKLGEVLVQAKNGDDGAIFRLNRMERAMTEFTESKTYRKMPTEGQEAAEREAERRERLDALLEQIAERRAGQQEAAGNMTTEGDSIPEKAGDKASTRKDASRTIGTTGRSPGGNDDIVQDVQVHTPGPRPSGSTETKPQWPSNTERKDDLGFPEQASVSHPVSFGRSAYREQAEITGSGAQHKKAIRRKA